MPLRSTNLLQRPAATFSTRTYRVHVSHTVASDRSHGVLFPCRPSGKNVWLELANRESLTWTRRRNNLVLSYVHNVFDGAQRDGHAASDRSVHCAPRCTGVERTGQRDVGRLMPARHVAPFSARCIVLLPFHFSFVKSCLLVCLFVCLLDTAAITKGNQREYMELLCSRNITTPFPTTNNNTLCCFSVICAYI